MGGPWGAPGRGLDISLQHFFLSTTSTFQTATLQGPLGGPWEAPGSAWRPPGRPPGGPWEVLGEPLPKQWSCHPPPAPGRGKQQLPPLHNSVQIAAPKTLYKTGCKYYQHTQNRPEGPLGKDCHPSGALGGPWEAPENLLEAPPGGPGRSLGGPWQGPGTSLCSTKNSLQNRLQMLPAHSKRVKRGHSGKTATLQGSLGGPWEAPGGPWETSWEAPWRPLGGPWGAPGRGLGRLLQ